MHRLDLLLAELKSGDSIAELLRTVSGAAGMIMVSMNQREGVETDVKPWTILWSTNRADELFGYLQGELAGMSLWQLIPERLRPAHEVHTENYSSHPVRRPMGHSKMDLSGLRQDGSEIPLQISLTPTTYSGLRVAIATIIESRPEPPHGRTPSQPQ